MSMKKLNASVVVSVTAFFIIFFIFCGFAIDFTLVLVSRSQLQNAVETAALASLDEYEVSKIEQRARNVFAYSKVGQIKHSKVNVTAKKSPRSVKVNASSPVPVFFLSALGIYQIEVQANAVAKEVRSSLLPFVSAKLPLPPNHVQYKHDIPFLSRGREVFVKGVSPDKPYRVFAALGDSDKESVRWVEITCSAQNDDGGTWYSIDNDCNGIGKLGAAQYVRLSLNNQSPPNYYWDWKDFSVSEISVISSVKLVKSSEF